MRNLRAMVFLMVGLGAGAIGGAFLVGRAHAQTQGARYQYKCLTGLPGEMFRPDTIAALNREGNDGWRLLDGISAQNHMNGRDQYCFVKQL